LRKTALLAGATGLVGSHLLKLLLNDESYTKVKIVSRKPFPQKHPKLENHLIDFDDLHNYTAILQADDAFCCLGTTIAKAGTKDAFFKVDYTYIHEFAKTALEGGAKQFTLVSSVGANAESSAFYLQVKGKLENDIVKLHYPTFNILRPSMLLGERTEVRTGELIGKTLMPLFSIFMQGPFKKYRAIQAATVAKAMLTIAKNPKEGVNIYESDEIELTGG